MKVVTGIASLIVLCLIGVGVLFTSGCSNAEIAHLKSWGSPHHIVQYSGGKVIGEWDSVGKVANEGKSSGYYFQDAATGKVVHISGQVTITIKK